MRLYRRQSLFKYLNALIKSSKGSDGNPQPYSHHTSWRFSLSLFNFILAFTHLPTSRLRDLFILYGESKKLSRPQKSQTKCCSVWLLEEAVEEGMYVYDILYLLMHEVSDRYEFKVLFTYASLSLLVLIKVIFVKLNLQIIHTLNILSYILLVYVLFCKVPYTYSLLKMCLFHKNKDFNCQSDIFGTGTWPIFYHHVFDAAHFIVHVSCGLRYM